MKKNNFGKQGWILIIVGLFVCFCGSIIASALNVVVPEFMEMYAWNRNELLSLSSYVGFLAAGAAILFSIIVSRGENGKAVSIFSLLITFVGLACWGFSKTIWQYFIFDSMIAIGVVGAGCYGLPILIGNWFPKKKGIIVGIVTVGSNVGTMLIALMLTGLWDTVGFRMGFIVFSLVALIPAVILIFGLKEKPEYQGCYPDNDTSLVMSNFEEQKRREKIIKETSPFTFKRLLCCKELWGLIIANGLFAMVLTGVTGNVMAASMSFGNTMEHAVGLTIVSSILAIPGSILLGYADAKFGTRIACIIVGVVGTVAMVICLFHGNMWAVIAGTITFGFFLGTSNNLVNSMLISVFGRYDFKNALAVLQPILAAIRMLGISIVSNAYEKTGTYDSGIIILIIFCAIGTAILYFVKDDCIGRTDDDIAKILKENDEVNQLHLY